MPVSSKSAKTPTVAAQGHRRGRSDGPVSTPPALLPPKRSSRPPVPSRKAVEAIDKPASQPIRKEPPLLFPEHVPNRGRQVQFHPNIESPSPAPPRSKPPRRTWDPSDTVARVSMIQAEKAAQIAQERGRINAQAVGERVGDIPEAEDAGDDELDDLEQALVQEEDEYAAWQDEPYQYRVTAVLKALASNNSTRRVRWQSIYPNNCLPFAFEVNSLDIEVGKAMEKYGFEECILEINISIRSRHSKGTRVHLSFEDLDQEQWDKKVEPVIKSEYRRYPGYILDISVEYTGKEHSQAQTNSKRPLDSPGPSPSHHRTRTIQQEAIQAEKRDINEKAGDLAEKLLDRWVCTNEKCGNHKAFCFVAYDGKHYSLDTTQRETWARAISRKDATIERPPDVLYDWLRQRKGAVNEVSKAPIAKAQREEREAAKEQRFERMMEMQERIQEIQMNKQFANALNSMVLPDHQASYSQPTQPPVYQAPFQYSPSLQYPPWFSVPPVLPAPGGLSLPIQSMPPVSTPTPTPISIAVASDLGVRVQTPPRPTRSSPISDEAEDDQIMDEFWDWRIELTSNPTRKARLIQARGIIERELWSIEHLKSMSDTSSAIYQDAIAKGLPGGLVVNFREELRRFKQVYRTQILPGRSLLNLRERHLEEERF